MSTTIVKGDELQLFYNGSAFAWATSHTLTLTGNTVDIATKDHGSWGASEIGNITWEITSENLYCDDDYDMLFDLMVQKEPITVVFAKVSNYDPNGLTRAGGEVSAWTYGTTYRQGNAVISSLTANANTGENATFSLTLTGAGPLTKVEPSNP